MSTCKALAVQWVKFGDLEIKFQAEVDASTLGGKAVLEIQDLVLAKGINYIQEGCSIERFKCQTGRSGRTIAITLQAGPEYWLGSYPVPSPGNPPQYTKFYYYNSLQSNATKWQLLYGPVSPVGDKQVVQTYLISNDRNYHWSYSRSTNAVTLEEDYTNQDQNSSNWFTIDTDNGLITPYNASNESKVYGPHQQNPATPFDSLNVSEDVGGPDHEVKVSLQ